MRGCRQSRAHSLVFHVWYLLIFIFSTKMTNTATTPSSEPKESRRRTSSRWRVVPRSPAPSKPSSPSATDQDSNPFQSLRFQPSVVDRFPPLDHADTAILSTDTQLQFFCLPTGLFVTKCPSLPIFYCFVWTPESGEHLYGCCLRFFEPVPSSTLWQFVQSQQSTSYKKSGNDKVDRFASFKSEKDCVGYFAPKCLCLISYHPFIAGYRTFLTELYRLSLTPNSVPIERYLCNLFLECPLPPRGYFSVRYNIGDKSLSIYISSVFHRVLSLKFDNSINS